MWIYICTTIDRHVELIEFDKLFWETNAKKANTFYCDITVPELIHNCIVVQILTHSSILLVSIWFRHQMLAIAGQCSVHIETICSICSADQLTGLQMNANWLMGQWQIHSNSNDI